jgi:hypothetical protein
MFLKLKTDLRSDSSFENIYPDAKREWIKTKYQSVIVKSVRSYEQFSRDIFLIRGKLIN